MTTRVFEDTAATAGEEFTGRGSSTASTALKNQIPIWRHGIVVASAVLAAALLSGGIESSALSTSRKRRFGTDIAESATADLEVDLEIHEEVRKLFDQGASEFFQDGTYSTFSRSLIDLLAKNGKMALKAISQYVLSGLAKEEVVAETLRWSGDYNDPTTMRERSRLLRISLRNSSPRVRDGAVLGLASMDDPRALPSLIEAQRAESISELRRLIGAVIEQLGATSHATTAADGQGEPVV